MIPNDIRFSKKRYEENDSIAKQVCREFFEQIGCQDIQENLNEAKRKFNEIWDLKATSPFGHEIRVEAEIKKDWGIKWKDVPFKYDTMDIPYRKRTKAEVHATHHMVIGGDLGRFFICSRGALESSPVSNKTVRNRIDPITNKRMPEPFFNIDIHHVESAFYFKVDNVWRIFKEQK